MRRSITLFFAFCTISIACFSQGIKINEISVCNISREMDSLYNFTGWIELYNPTDQNINLANLYYSNIASMPKRFKLTKQRVLPAKGFATIWLNNEVADGKGYFLDTSADGGFLSVADASGNILDQITYPAQKTNISYGRVTDGDAAFAYFMKSSRNKSNNGIKTASLSAANPAFSKPGGFYSDSIYVEIASTLKTATIYYTTDGSLPDSTKTIYTTPILIKSNTPLRAVAIQKDLFPSQIITATYMIKERKPKLPIVFLATDPKFLYNDTIGIYCVGTNGIVDGGVSTPCNYNQNWSRPANLEFMTTNGQTALNQMIGIEISGNATRHYPQKSIKLKAAKKYGVARLDYPFFKDKAGQRYKSIVLSNGGQDYYKGGVRDVFAEKASSALNLEYKEYEPAVLYLNGQYWGYMYMRERNNSDYLYSNFGYSEDSVDIVENNWIEQAATGNLDQYNVMRTFIETNDPTSDTNYQKIKSLLDIDHYINYMAVEFFGGNDDWPANNQVLYRYKNGGKWDWILQDLDKTYTRTTFNKYNELITSTSVKFPVKMFTYLIKNPTFKSQYITAQCLVAGSVFAPVHTAQILDTISAKLDAEFAYHAVKWALTNQYHNYFRENITYHKTQTANYVTLAYNNLKTNFSLGNIIGLKIESTAPKANIEFNDQTIPVMPYDGKYFEGSKLKLKAQLYVNGHKFSNWIVKTDSSQTTVSDATLELNAHLNTSIKAVYDSTKTSTRTGLFINEISAANATYADNLYKAEDWVEIYNNSDKAIDLDKMYLSDDSLNRKKFQFIASAPKNLMIPPNQYLVVWCSGAVVRGDRHTSFKLAKEGGVVTLSTEDENGVRLIDSVRYISTSERYTFGRVPDASDHLMKMEIATFAKKNIASTYNTFAYDEINNQQNGMQAIKESRPIALVYHRTSEMLEINSEGTDAGRIYLFDLSGRLLITREINGGKTEISTSGITARSFIVRAETRNNRTISKFVK